MHLALNGSPMQVKRVASPIAILDFEAHRAFPEICGKQRVSTKLPASHTQVTRMRSPQTVILGTHQNTRNFQIDRVHSG